MDLIGRITCALVGFALITGNAFVVGEGLESIFGEGSAASLAIGIPYIIASLVGLVFLLAVIFPDRKG